MKKVIVLLLALLSLTSCAYSDADLAAARSQGYKEGYDDGYEEGYDDGYSALKPISRPASGAILSGRKYYDSEITVTADSSYDYVVSLKGAGDVTFLSFYVRAGDTVTVGVPARNLYVYFASGKEWYGYGKGLMFGKNTSYSKDDELLDFGEYTWEYTLYPVNNGNFSETPSNENEFF